VLSTLDNSKDTSTNQGKVFQGVGGVGKNIAETIHRLGSEAVLISLIGQDNWGQTVKNYFEKLGMSTEGLLLSSGLGTGVYNSISSEKGHTISSVTSMKIFDSLTPEVIQPLLDSQLTNSNYVCLDGNLPVKIMAIIAKACHDAKIPLWYEPTSPYKCAKIVLGGALEWITFISPTITEMEEIARALGYKGPKRDAIECAKTLFKVNPKLNIVSHSQSGVDLFRYDVNNGNITQEHFPSNPSVPVVNRTGAGDTLVGAILIGLTNNMSLDDAIKLGIRAAEATIQSDFSVAPELSPEFLKTVL